MSPSIAGLITQRTGDAIYSMYFVVALYALAGSLLLLAVRASDRQRPAG